MRVEDLQVEHGEDRRMLSGVNFGLATSIFFSRHASETSVEGGIRRSVHLFVIVSICSVIEFVND